MSSDFVVWNVLRSACHEVYDQKAGQQSPGASPKKLSLPSCAHHHCLWFSDLPHQFQYNPLDILRDEVSFRDLFSSAYSNALLLLLDSGITTQGLSPLWLFNIRYRFQAFTILNAVFLSFALKHLGKEMETRPDTFSSLNNL